MEKPVQEELYNLDNDPLEKTNLVCYTTYNDILESLRKRLHELRCEYSRDSSGFPEWMHREKNGKY